MIFQVFKVQLERDKSILDLFSTMEDVYSFANDVEAIPSQLARFKDTAIKIMQQTVECCLFVQEYVGKGFGSTPTLNFML